MNSDLRFDFIVNKENHTVNVKKEFAARHPLVWDAFTKAELLDQWWAPKPWVSKTKSMEFKVGGRRLYAMCGPAGEKQWCLADYTSIDPITSFAYLDAFCDSEGNISNEIQQASWKLDFTGQQNSTLVDIVIAFKTLEDLENHIELGFKEGFTMTINELDELLPQWNAA